MTTRYAPRAAYQSFSPDIPPIVYKPRRQQTSFFHPAIESTAEVIEARQSRTASFRPVSTPINAGWGSY